MTREELIKYIAVYGSHSAAIMVDCKDCPLLSSCEERIRSRQSTTSSCSDILERFYISETKVKDDNENNISAGRVPLRSLKIGEWFLLDDKLFVVIGFERVMRIPEGIGQFLSEWTFVEKANISIVARKEVEER